LFSISLEGTIPYDVTEAGPNKYKVIYAFFYFCAFILCDPFDCRSRNGFKTCDINKKTKVSFHSLSLYKVIFNIAPSRLVGLDSAPRRQRDSVLMFLMILQSIQLLK